MGSADMLTTYVCLEGLSLLSYGVIATNKTSGSAEAGLKYFLYGIIASALLIFGLSLLYIQTKELS
jgi:NADH-quinone oxidoreductase subunit N